MTAAAPPPAATLEAMQRQGFRVTHVYGLTETYGPVGGLRLARRVERAADRRAGAS